MTETARLQPPGSPPASHCAAALKRGTAMAAAIPILVVLAAYVWIVSLGTWTNWPKAYDYSHYDQLASSFMHGQLYLQQAPSAELLALTNPYDPAQRGDMPYLIDASLFGGRYYLYFGPVPALLLIPIKLLLHGTIYDIYLVFAFSCGLFLLQAAFLLWLRRRFFPGVPAWVAFMCILVLGLSTPYTWMLGSQAAPHNAAITAGQAFFMAGLWMALESLAADRVRAGMAIAAGVLWVGAIGSRVTQLGPVAVVILLIQIHLARKHPQSGHARFDPREILPFALPLILGAGALGWYNWARFGSVLEMGTSYQLAMLPIQRYAGDLFSVRYVLQALHNYVLNPPRLRYVFPYVWPQIGARSPVLAFISLPPIYFTEENTGLIYTFPLLIFSIISALGFGRTRTASASQTDTGRLFGWIESCLAGAFLAGLATFAAFFWTSNRYVLDFAPPFLILSILEFWRISESLRGRPAARAAILALGVLIMFFTLVCSAGLTIGQNAGAFSGLDPHISRQLRRLFGP